MSPKITEIDKNKISQISHLGIYEQSTRPRPDPVLFHSWGTLNGLLIATEIVGDDASIICIMFQT